MGCGLNDWRLNRSVNKLACASAGKPAIPQVMGFIVRVIGKFIYLGTSALKVLYNPEKSFRSAG
jgi:hypothetical protein